MANSKKKKSAKQKRILVASVLLAAFIMAGGTFAWFGAKDEITNKLTATSNYGVLGTEDFTAVDNWTPGQAVNKDVYAVNTGNVAAFVQAELTNNFTLTVPGKSLDVVFKDKDNTLAISGSGDAAAIVDTDGTRELNKLDTIKTTDLVELSDSEREAIESGSRLVYPYTYTITTYNETSTKSGSTDTETASLKEAEQAEYQRLLTLYFDAENVKDPGENQTVDTTYTATSEEVTATGTVKYVYTYTPGTYTVKETDDDDNGKIIYNNDGKITVKEYTTSQIVDDDTTNVVDDWKPSATGVYIFERNSGDDATVTTYKKYAGYYYVKGSTESEDKYYALDEINVETDKYGLVKTIHEQKISENKLVDKDSSTAEGGDNDQITTVTLQTKTDVSEATNTKIEFLANEEKDAKYVSTDSDTGEKYLTVQVSFTDPAADTNESPATKTMKVFVYLDKDYDTNWTMNPVETGDSGSKICTGMEFYYNNILEGGKSTEKLVDKLVLDENIKPGDFNEFEYDLNVIINSIQAIASEDGSWSAEAVEDASWKLQPVLDNSESVEILKWAAATSE
jgi:alternate signal-mediated exported protein